VGARADRRRAAPSGTRSRGGGGPGRRALAGIAAAALACTPAVPEPRPSLLLLSLDTLRADRLGSYGYGLPTSPALDRLAARGVRFERAYAAAPWTLPSHMTLFTGLHPSRHGATRWASRLADEVPTLAEVLARAGYRTFGFTTGGFVASRYGFGRGFEVYHEQLEGFPSLLERARAAIEGVPPDRPWLVFLQTFATHCPYTTTPRYERAFHRDPAARPVERKGVCLAGPDLELSPERITHLSERYDASIRTADDALDRFVAWLEARGALEHTVVVIVSDHGEEFGEHGRLFHGYSLYEEQLRVPWIVLAPGLAPRSVDTPVSLVDLFATVLDLLGVPAPDNDGRSLRPLLEGGDAPARPLFGETDNHASLRGVVVGRHKLVLDRASGEVELFDLARDPGERDDLAGRAPALRERLRALLDAHLDDLAPLARPAEARLSEEHVEQLRALGYVEDELEVTPQDAAGPQ